MIHHETSIPLRVLEALFDGFADRIAARLLLKLQPFIREEQQAMAQIDDELAQLTAEVSTMSSTVDSAVAVIDGITAKIQAAVQEALAAGATPEELQAVTDITAALSAQKQRLGDAVASQGSPAPAPTP